jgi:hypothetical protein
LPQIRLWRSVSIHARPDNGAAASNPVRCVLPPIIPIRRLPHPCRAEAVRQRIVAYQVRCSDSAIVPVTTNVDRTTPCARASLPGADVGCHPFRPVELISGCSIRKDAERTKGENRQNANHGQILSQSVLLPSDGQEKRGRERRTRSPTHGNSRSGVERTTRSRCAPVRGTAPARRLSGMAGAVRAIEVMSLTRDCKRKGMWKVPQQSRRWRAFVKKKRHGPAYEGDERDRARTYGVTRWSRAPSKSYADRSLVKLLPRLGLTPQSASRASRSQRKLGRRSAPLVPQARQVKRGSISDSRTSSGH